MKTINEGYFAAVDFETAVSFDRHTACSIGVIVFEDFKITKRYHKLIQPPGNIYHPDNIALHGITPEMTAGEPTLNKSWDDIRAVFSDMDLVAHNAQFDSGVMINSLAYYGIQAPGNAWYCTKNIYKIGLKALCDQLGINLNHHNALSDAEACGLAMVKYLKG